MVIVKKILFPTDFSDCSFAAIEYIKSLALIYDAQVHLLNVIDNNPALVFQAIDYTSETVLRNAENDSVVCLDRIVSEHFLYSKDCVRAIRRGDVSKEIVRYAEEEGIDLIIVATHGRTGFAHVVMGSVAEKVVRHSSVPVLTVKPEKILEKYLEQTDIDDQLYVKM